MVFAIYVPLAFFLGLLATKPLHDWLQRRQETPMPPARRKLMSTTFCVICRQRVPYAETEYTARHGHTCTKHHLASAETLQVAA